ncbi:MAG: hypothetical protein MUD01_22510, partial [Chloroflexaceae bacterium]|nr:hypothetical protein [Chloroflexaceae bacterium]
LPTANCVTLPTANCQRFSTLNSIILINTNILFCTAFVYIDKIGLLNYITANTLLQRLADELSEHDSVFSYCDAG